MGTLGLFFDLLFIPLAAIVTENCIQQLHRSRIYYQLKGLSADLKCRMVRSTRLRRYINSLLRKGT